MRLLQEIGRVNIAPDQWMSILRRDFGVTVCTLPLGRVVAESLNLPWTRDPFDRLIVANAKAAEAPLVTRDQRILDHYSHAVW